MSEITKPIALDESLHTTEPTPRNLADVLSDELQNLATAISGGSDKVPKTDIATVESGSTASRAYSVGELVYVNGNLYKVITSITIGATFTVGTNIQSTTVSGTINERMITTTTSGSTTASGNIVANAPAGNVFPIASKLTSPVDCYVIPYWITSGSMWAFRVKQNDDSALTSTSVTIETIWVKL